MHSKKEKRHGAADLAAKIRRPTPKSHMGNL
jgi:hypothetical protein